MSWSTSKIWISRLTVLSLILTLLAGGFVPAAEAAPGSDNLALNRPATTSQGVNGSAVVDGDPTTYWRPSLADREDLNVWLQVDLGPDTSFNSIDYDISRSDMMNKLDVLYSDDGEQWHTAASRSGTIQQSETIRFDTISARYIKFDITMTRNLMFDFREFAVYLDDAEEIPADMERIYFVDSEGSEYPENAELVLELGEEAPLKLLGRSSSGDEVDLEPMAKSYASMASSVAGISREGVVSGYKVGAARVYAEVEKPDGSQLRTPFFWIKVVDANEFRVPGLIANTELIHNSMTLTIGQPAVLQPGDALPSVRVEPTVAATVSGVLSRNGEPGNTVIPEQSFEALESRELSLGGHAEAKGEYALKLRIVPEDKPDQAYNDTYYFTVMEPSDVPEGASQIAYPDKVTGKMVYVPDYRGNRIIDFSNAGYGGGGVPLPDVQARVVVEPGDGEDDTARIQAAIDQVSLMPVRSDGFRGAVLLKKGEYRIGGTLSISTGGIVLRGEGDGEDGTVLRATGTAKRNIIEVGKGTGPVLNTSTRQEIVDLYVPSGARSFEVADASNYNVGDTVIVRRNGNERWIHEIGMDYIYMRPGTDGSRTSQWTPFNLDFDRVITAIDGDVVTVDAPIANAIERRWGGGELYRYTDDSRIEQIGIERMRVISDFDPSITDTVMDNSTTDQYYADEDHAERFVVMDSVKNAWVRDVAGYHLSYALVQMGRNSKWITVQDSEMYDMVSIITGGRRYTFHMQGQQTLVQRVYTETARHAFIIDSRIQGPNVVLDSVARKNYNTSEPHHKWSVGGLFDNVDAAVSIRDRAWLGSGHGWSGANYVNWNTTGELTSQQPPTAQNYVIGHVYYDMDHLGEAVKPLVPSRYDPRPRKDAYWESPDEYITSPNSLYKQQLLDRLGQEAVDALGPDTYGGGDKDIPPAGEGDPLLSGISLDGAPLADFAPEIYNYTVKLPLGAETAPTVTATAKEGFAAEVEQAASPQGMATITVYEMDAPDNRLQYQIQFESLPVLGSVPPNLTVYPIESAEAKDSHANYPPSNAIDGDLSAGSRWAGRGIDQWIVFDLGRIHSISYVLTARFDESRYDYDIELSTDGTEWTPVSTNITSSGTPNLLEPVNFDATDARYVRLVTRGSDKDDWNNLNEIVIAGFALTELELEGPTTLSVGESAQTITNVVHNDGSREQVKTGVTYTSSDPEIAEINADGVVTAKSEGTGRITAEYAGLTASYELTVTKEDSEPEPELVRLELNGPDPRMRVNTTLRLLLTAAYDDGTRQTISDGVIYTSSQPRAATVSEDGVVSAHHPGAAVITASYEGKTASYMVRVNAAGGAPFK